MTYICTRNTKNVERLSKEFLVQRYINLNRPNPGKDFEMVIPFKIIKNVKKKKRASKRKKEKKVRRRAWLRRLLVGGAARCTLDHRCQGHYWSWLRSMAHATDC